MRSFRYEYESAIERQSIDGEMECRGAVGSRIDAVVAVSDRAPYTGGRLEAIDEQEDANWAGGAGRRRDPAVETLDRLEPVESFIEIVRRIESIG